MTDLELKIRTYRRHLERFACRNDSGVILDLLTIAEEYAAATAPPNESRELAFARVILAQQIDVTGEVRALAEDTVARAKLAARTR